MNKIINCEPRPYQKHILDSLQYVSSIGLFLGTGSGKTLTSLMRFNQNPTTNLLVLCPSKVVEQWIDVIDSHTKLLNVVKYNNSWTAKKRYEVVVNAIKSCNKFNAIVFSLESLKNVPSLKEYITEDWTIILDESHKIKSLGTKKNPVKTTKAVLDLKNCTNYKIILTATPTQKDKGGYIDYYTQLDFLGYMDMSLEQFKSRYCVEKKIQVPGTPFPIKIIVKYTDKVREIEDILKLTCRRYVPSFTEVEPQHNKVLLTSPKSYKDLVKQRHYHDFDLRSLSARRMALKTLCTGKTMGHDVFGNRMTHDDNTVKADWLEEFLANTDDVVMVVYKYNVEKDTLVRVCEKLNKKYIVLDGAAKNKYDLINNKDYDVVIGQFNACGESIDGLQYKCHICVFYCLPESSIEYKQTLGRINRDGQKYAVSYYYPMLNNTIETKIWDMLQNKIDFDSKVLDNLVI